MSEHFSVQDGFRENRLFLSRIVVSVMAMMLGVSALVFRLVYLQVTGHEQYASLSRDNQIKIAPIPPNRGMIFDRNGEVLADNFVTYSLEVTPELVKDLPGLLRELKTVMSLTETDLEQFQALKAKRKGFESVPVRLGLTEEEVARIAIKLPWLVGAEIHTRMMRNYPYGDLTAHVVGYIARINDKELASLDPAQYRGTFFIGKNGLEKSYEPLLHGKTGHEEYEANVKGRVIRSMGTTEAIDGANLHLSLDIGLQKTAMDALGPYHGAVVAIDPRNGEVLALASKPSYDPNPFIQGISTKNYAALQNDEARPLYDRATRGTYPPGSTVKPLEALAGLELLNLSPASRIACPGYFRLPGSKHKYRDWAHSGHGATDMRLAIVQSCDVYFYSLANRLGIQRLHDFMRGRFGLGEVTGLDIVGEKAGLYPTEEWKRKARKAEWIAGDTVIAGIGQGFVTTTPLQMARATAILANKGLNVEPRLVSRIKAGWDYENPFPRREQAGKPIEANQWNTVVNAMVDVVQRGTAKRISGGLGYRMAGKTGTAQVFSVAQGKSYKSMRVTKSMRDHAWFIAFAPAEAPEIAVAVIAENAGHGGTVSAPIARKVIDRWLRPDSVKP
jgi:penicillin-binding protein 2